MRIASMVIGVGTLLLACGGSEAGHPNSAPIVPTPVLVPTPTRGAGKTMITEKPGLATGTNVVTFSHLSSGVVINIRARLIGDVFEEKALFVLQLDSIQRDKCARLPSAVLTIDGNAVAPIKLRSSVEQQDDSTRKLLSGNMPVDAFEVLSGASAVEARCGSWRHTFSARSVKLVNEFARYVLSKRAGDKAPVSSCCTDD